MSGAAGESLGGCFRWCWIKGKKIVLKVVFTCENIKTIGCPIMEWFAAAGRSDRNGLCFVYGLPGTSGVHTAFAV